MRTKSSARRGARSRRPGIASVSCPSSPPPPISTPNHSQADASSFPEDEVLVVPDTYGDSQGKEQSRDQEVDARAEKVPFPMASEGKCLPDEIMDDQELDKSRCCSCREGGELLVCGENSCPIAIHEKCLNCKPRFDESGSFYCPYCRYKRMVVKVRELRRKSILAEEKLIKFLEPRGDEQGGKKLEGERSGGLGSHECPSNGNDIKDDNNKEVDDNDRTFQGSEPVNQLHENSSGSIDILAGHERNKQKVKPVLALTVALYQHGDSSYVPEDEASARNQTYEGTAGPLVLIPREMVLPLRAIASRESVERNFPADQTNSQFYHPGNRRDITPVGVKRKPLPWRVEEEKMLEEAKHIQKKVKNTSWKKILEYGRGVFDETRTPTDLKDKWKTMIKNRR